MSSLIKIRCSRGSKHREAIEASRNDVIEDSGAIVASRSDAPGASQMTTRQGLKGEAPPRVIIGQLPMLPAVLSC